MNAGNVLSLSRLLELSRRYEKLENKKRKQKTSKSPSKLESESYLEQTKIKNFSRLLNCSVMCCRLVMKSESTASIAGEV
jgi:hypothetical protein